MGIGQPIPNSFQILNFIRARSHLSETLLEAQAGADAELDTSDLGIRKSGQID